MTSLRTRPFRRPAVVGPVLLAAALVVAACSGDPAAGEPRDPGVAGSGGGGTVPTAGMLVSGAVPRALVPHAPAAAGSLVFVAASPGTFPGARRARLRSSRGDSALAPATDGGFDPQPVRGEEGDEVTVTVIDSAGRETTTRVPARARPPRVVRTSPQPNRTDVPLNIRVTVVFSTPMDSASVAGAVTLVAVGGPVPGTVELETSALAAHFIPAAPLAANADYELRVASEARDVLGTPLGAPLTVPFRTNADPGPPPPLRVEVRVSGEDRASRFWLRDALGDCALLNIDPMWFGCNQYSLAAGVNLLYPETGNRAYMLESPGRGNCVLSGSAVRAVTVTPGATAEIVFDVTCAAIPPVSVRVRALGTGGPLPPYLYAETGTHGACNTAPCWISWPYAGANELPAFPGVQEVRLRTPSHCNVLGRNPVAANVVAGAVTDVLFQIACTAPGFVRVRVAATGTNIPSGFAVDAVPCNESLDNCFWMSVLNGGSQTSGGLRADTPIEIRLRDQENCRVTSDNPVRFTPRSNRLSEVTFELACE